MRRRAGDTARYASRAAGAKVVKSPIKEIGWYKVQVTPEGQEDPFLAGFNERDLVYHWHGDMFMVPENGVLLATADGCPHQALRVGRNAYGVQFHVEVTDYSIKEWCEEYLENDLPGRREHAGQMLKEYYHNQQAFNNQANTIYQNFIRIVEHAKNSPITN